MSFAHSMSIVFKAVDNISAPMRRISDNINRTFEPMRQMNKSLAGLAQASGLGQLGKSLGGVAGGMKDVAGEAAKLLGGISLVGGGLAYAFKSGFLDTAAEFEKFRSVLTTLEGSSEKASASMNWISDFAAKTPYELGEVTKAFVKLKSYGINATDGTLKAIGDAAAASPSGNLDQMVEAFADAQNGEFARLKEAIGGSFETKGNYLEYTFQDKDGKERVFAAVKNDAKALQEMVLKAFEAKGYTGAMDNLSKTWAGMMSNLSDAWTRFANMIMDAGAFDWMKETLGSILDTINAMSASGELQRLAKEFGTKLTEGLKVAWAAAKELGAVFMRFMDFLPKLASFMGGWGNLLIGVGVIIAGPLLAALASLTAAFVTLGVTIGLTPIGWFLGIAAAIAAAAYLIIDNWGELEAFFKNAFASVEQGLNELMAYFDIMVPRWAQMGVNIVSGLLDGLRGAWASVTGWFRDAMDGLLSLVPDGLKAQLGLSTTNAAASAPTSTGAAAVSTGSATGAAGVITQAAQTSAAGANGGGEAALRVTFDNMPREAQVKTEKAQDMWVDVDLGWSLPAY